MDKRIFVDMNYMNYEYEKFQSRVQAALLALQ